ncbi:sugar transferase [filamentous cyanobacterium CCP5]|nr:sugar transferase [filamentous cyanobacterium CCP5]
MDGICTLGNDRVYDQIVALINSIEANGGPQMPICIFPYDDQTQRLQALAADRPEVQLYDDNASIQRWDAFVKAVWATHPTAPERWRAAGSQGIHRMGTHRRLCAFDGPFDRFLYMDADTLLLQSPQRIFDYLNDYDWVTYDFQHKDLSHVFDGESEWLNKLFSIEQLQQVFCSGFYASRRGMFSPELDGELLQRLQSGEGAVLYPMAPDQTVLNYLVLRSQLRVCNLARHLPVAQRTGNSVTSSHFVTRAGQGFDGETPLTYLHYIGVSSRLFSTLCRGENVDFPYREIFLHYRYWHAPEQQPRLQGPCQPYQARRWRRWAYGLSKIVYESLQP